MDLTQIVVKLIKQYQSEHNRLVRSQRQKHRINADQQYQADMKRNGLGTSIFCAHDQRLGEYDFKKWRNSFVDDRGEPTQRAFMSTAHKNRALKQVKKDLQQYRESQANPTFRVSPDIIINTEKELAKLEKAPVFPKLGKKWKAYVAAFIEENKAYKERWIARCAIKGFNKLDLDLRIKFGNCNTGGGSMNAIVAVNAGGFDVPLKKFLENAEFEQVLLNTAEAQPQADI